MRADYHRQHGRELTTQEFVDVFNLDKEEVYEVYSQIAMQNPTSLDQTLYPEEDNPHASVDTTLKDKLEDPQIKEMRGLFEDQEILLLTLKRMPLRERKFFIFTHNLCELAHDDIQPNQDELTSFFLHQSVRLN
jgi:DNA-directed RNA polymerase specialized sigma subunit